MYNKNHNICKYQVYQSLYFYKIYVLNKSKITVDYDILWRFFRDLRSFFTQQMHMCRLRIEAMNATLEKSLWIKNSLTFNFLVKVKGIFMCFFEIM